MSSSKSLTRTAQRIHLADKSYLETREVRLELLGDTSEIEDDLQTLALLRFSVDSSELDLLVDLGLVEREFLAAVSDKASVVVVFRTDRDLLDEEDDEFWAEWSRIETDPTASLELWADLDLWEFESAHAE